MDTKPLNNKSNTDNSKKWSRASIAAAVAAGAITVEAANILYAQLKEDEPTPQPDDNQDAIAENVVTPVAETSGKDTPAAVEDEVVATPEPVRESVHEPERQTVNERDHRPETNVNRNSEDNIHTPRDEKEDDIPTPTPRKEEDNIVDVIVEEIDPQDIDVEDVILVDDIGTIYTEEGDELTAAIIHNEDGTQAMLVDVDGDNVYDVIVGPQGNESIPSNVDIDTSDVELMYAQQHDHSGYIEKNEFDVAMNEENPEIEDNMQLT